MKIFHLPDLGEGLAEAEIREWYVKAGEQVTVDQPLVSMETAKAVVDVPSPYAGKIAELHGSINDIIKTGAPLISIETEAISEDQGSVVGKLETSEKKWEEAEIVTNTTHTTTSTPKVMPAARLLAQQMQVDLTQVTPTGPQGLITAQDIKTFLEKNKTASPFTTGKTETLHGVRRTMAQVMLKSHATVVPVTIVDDANITDLASGDLTLHLLKAMVAAAKNEPSLNAWFDAETLERKLFDEIHIGLAMDTEEGLFVPVIKNVENKSPKEIRQIIDDYKKSVKTRSITPDHFQGATITLSNFGTMAGRYATPIVVPPTVAILGVGRSRETVLIEEGKMKIGRILPLSLTIDHKAVTGGEAARFLGNVIHYLQNSPVILEK